MYIEVKPTSKYSHEDLKIILHVSNPRKLHLDQCIINYILIILYTLRRQFFHNLPLYIPDFLI